MEKLKRVIPKNIKEMIGESTPNHLSHTCSLLLDFFLHLPLFHHVVEELTDPGMRLCSKNMDSASDFKKKGNDCFSRRDFPLALSFYSRALRLAPICGDDMDKEFLATIYVNRATTMHNLGLLKECIRDCGRAILVSPGYVKAWYRRGKANASLENYEGAIHDLNVALSMENSLSKRSQIIRELETLSKHCKTSSGTSNSHTKCMEKSVGSLVEADGVRLQCVSTPAKGRGMVALHNIPPACLIHSEEPYAAVILKQCCETHCHFCFSELPRDSIPCTSCTIPLYCSEICQKQARLGSESDHQRDTSLENITADVKRHITGVNLSRDEVSNERIEQIPEHRHECGGINWPAVLPPEIVLAGRVLVKTIEKRRHIGECSTLEDLDLCHNYTHMPLESKLELHIYSIILAHCLQRSFGVEFPLAGASAAKLVILIAQVKVNSMAIVHMKSHDSHATMEQVGKLSGAEDALTSNIEQVRVGQAIYLTGSLFNHSCQPNIHAYFISRTLFIRSIEAVSKEFPLELSYGPQVGQWDLSSRQLILEELYSFKCNCCGCSEQNISDLVMHAFRCVNPNCIGAVISCQTMIDGRPDIKHSPNVPSFNVLNRPLPVQRGEREAISEVAQLLFKQSVAVREIGSGYCLTCGSYRDIESSYAALVKAETSIKRLQNKLTLKTVATPVLADALKSLDLLRLVMHAYSKNIAQAEDSIAEALCLLGDFETAMHHCKTSIEVLRRLYPSNHIAIGNELMKLASIQLSMNDHSSALNSISKVDEIFSLHYGPHTAGMFPYLENLKKLVLTTEDLPV